MQNTFITWQLLLRKIKGEPLDKAEEQRLRAWLDEAPEHRAYFERACRHHLQPDTNGHTDLDKLIRRFDRFAAHAPQPRRRPVRPAHIRPYIAWAAILLLPLCMYIGFRFLPAPQTQPTEVPAPPSAIVPGSNYAQVILDDGSRITLNNHSDSARCLSEGMRLDAQAGVLSYDSGTGQERRNTLVVPRGGQYTLELSDGTRIWVNADSQLEYPTRFNGTERTVSLRGEAYFEVARNNQKPFIVHTPHQTIRVYGTSFNLEAYPGEGKESTTLVNGSVGVAFRGQEFKLAPGQQALADNRQGRVNIRTVDARQVCAWHTGILSVENERLENILTKLSRWYDVGFNYQDSGLKDLHFTGDLERLGDFHDILRLIGMTTSVDFIVHGRQVDVVSR